MAATDPTNRGRFSSRCACVIATIPATEYAGGDPARHGDEADGDHGGGTAVRTSGIAAWALRPGHTYHLQRLPHALRFVSRHLRMFVIQMTAFSVRLPEHLMKEIDVRAKPLDIPRSEYVRLDIHRMNREVAAEERRERLDQDSDLLIDELRAIDNRRLSAGALARLSGDEMRAIYRAICEVLEDPEE